MVDVGWQAPTAARFSWPSAGDDVAVRDRYGLPPRHRRATGLISGLGMSTARRCSPPSGRIDTDLGTGTRRCRPGRADRAPIAPDRAGRRAFTTNGGARCRGLPARRRSPAEGLPTGLGLRGRRNRPRNRAAQPEAERDGCAMPTRTLDRARRRHGCVRTLVRNIRPMSTVRLAPHARHESRLRRPDAFLRAFRFLDGFRGDRKFGSRLFSITRNCAMDSLRPGGSRSCRRRP
jgi:hypothetical protein